VASFHLPIVSGDSGFLRYLDEVKQIPSLEPEEEFMLAKRYVEHQDTSAAHKLVTSHLKLVAKIAMKYRGYGLPVVELVSEGNIGLMQAVKKFNPDKGFRLTTYAIWWIKAAIQEYVLKSWSLVKIGTTAAQKKLFFNLGKIKRRILNLEAREFSCQDYGNVAEELGVSEKDVAEMNSRMTKDKSLDDPLNDSTEASFVDLIPSAGANQEVLYAEYEQAKNRKDLLAGAMLKLSDRERHIISERRLKDEPTTLDELSKYYGVSRERVRQIEVRALEKLQENIQA
jgi:RNA polymerase sigma-32 factor